MSILISRPFWYALTLACVPLALDGCSSAYSETETTQSSQTEPTPAFFNLSLSLTGGPSAGLPALAGLYQIDSFNYSCTSGYTYAVILSVEVVAGPDMGMIFSLPPAGQLAGGGNLKFWLHPLDQLQLDQGGGGTASTCTLFLIGEVVPGTLQNLH